MKSPDPSKWLYIAAGVGVIIVIALIALALRDLSSSPSGAPSASGSSALPPALSSIISPPGSNMTASQKTGLFPQVPPWSSYQGVINGPNGRDALSAADLKGKVVLVDFWTYSCINCLRTLPYLTAWDNQYRSQGLVIVGIHSPEFDFEKDRSNVQSAVDKYAIHYPVVLDGDHQIWNQFGNNYWPRHYLIDKDGFVRDDHIGEGGYSETENAIRALLSEGMPNTTLLQKMPVANITPGETSSFDQSTTPEMYFGGAFRRQPIGNDNGNPTRPGIWRNFTLPASLQPNSIYLNGTWLDAYDHMQLQDAQGDIVLHYTSRSVYLVASASPNQTEGSPGANCADGANCLLPPTPTAFISATLDGQPIAGPDANSNGTVVVSGSRLYRVAQTSDYGTHTLVLHITGANFSAYSFTFG